jgi:hypothetical protein
MVLSTIYNKPLHDEEMSTVTSSLNAVKADKWCEGCVPACYNAQMMWIHYEERLVVHHDWVRCTCHMLISTVACVRKFISHALRSLVCCFRCCGHFRIITAHIALSVKLNVAWHWVTRYSRMFGKSKTSANLGKSLRTVYFRKLKHLVSQLLGQLKYASGVECQCQDIWRDLGCFCITV